MDQEPFIELMCAAISCTDGVEVSAFAEFETRLLDKNDPQLVWDLFQPVREPLLRRLYGMAMHQLKQASEAQPTPTVISPSLHSRTASETQETVDSSVAGQPIHVDQMHSTVSTPRQRLAPVAMARSRSARSARSAQDVIMAIGGRKSHLDWIHNHRGRPIGDLTYMGLANAHDEAPLFQRYAHRLMEFGIPRTGREGDVVRRFITPDEADRMWLDLMKEAAV